MRKSLVRISKNWILFYLSLLILSACKTIPTTSNKTEFDLNRVEADIEYLASDELEGRGTGQKGEKLAADYIAGRMKALGLKPMGTDGYFQDFSVKNKENPHGADFSSDSEKGEISVRNVIGYLDNSADNTIVIGAHFDHLGYGGFGSLHTGSPAIHNGADDNASGVAGLLWLAQQINNHYTKNNFLFIAFSGEEHGLWGSNYFTKNPTIPIEKINYMINMDMIGRLKKENKLSINGIGTSPVWPNVLEKIVVKDLSIVTTPGGIGASDHTSFYLSQVPAIHFFTGQHSDYHKPSDDENKINYKGMDKVLQYILSLVSELNNKGKLTFTETKDADEQSRRSFKVTLGVVPDYLFDGKGMRIDGVREDRPAANAGITGGDIVIKMGDHEVVDMNSYMDLLSSFEPGQTIIVKILRDKKIMEKTVTFD